MSSEDRASTKDLLDLPSTLENAHAKLNALIVNVEVNNRLTDRAVSAWDTVLDEIRQARKAAETAANHAMKRSSLLPRERMGALFAGAFTGSALVTLIMWLTGLGAAGMAISSCSAAVH